MPLKATRNASRVTLQAAARASLKLISTPSGPRFMAGMFLACPVIRLRLLKLIKTAQPFRPPPVVTAIQRSTLTPGEWANRFHVQSCHGGHNVLPPENPLSTLHPKRIAATCGHCHPEQIAVGSLLKSLWVFRIRAHGKADASRPYSRYQCLSCHFKDVAHRESSPPAGSFMHEMSQFQPGLPLSHRGPTSHEMADCIRFRNDLDVGIPAVSGMLHRCILLGVGESLPFLDVRQTTQTVGQTRAETRCSLLGHHRPAKGLSPSWRRFQSLFYIPGCFDTGLDRTRSAIRSSRSRTCRRAGISVPGGCGARTSDRSLSMHY